MYNKHLLCIVITNNAMSIRYFVRRKYKFFFIHYQNMIYGSLQAALTHALAERGEKDLDGNPIKPVGKLYDDYAAYKEGQGKKDKVYILLERMKKNKPQATIS